MRADALAAVSRKALVPWVERGEVVADDGTGGYDVLVPGRSNPWKRVRTLSGTKHSVGDKVVVLLLNRNRQLPVILDTVGRSAPKVTTPLDVVTGWPMIHHDPARTAAADRKMKPPQFASNRFMVLDRQLRAMKADERALYYVERDSFFVFDFSGAKIGQSFGQGAGAQFVVADVKAKRLFVVAGDRIYHYNVESWATPMEVLLIGNAVWPGASKSEPTLVGARLWVARMDTLYYWSLKGVSRTDVTVTDVPAHNIDWQNWATTAELPNSHAPDSYPMLPFEFWPFGGNCSLSPVATNFVSESGWMAMNGNDPDFIAQLASEAASRIDYESVLPRNIPVVGMRSQIFKVNLNTGERRWNAAGVRQGKYVAWEPVGMLGNVLLTHWEQTEYAPFEFYHAVATTGIQEFIDGLRRGGVFLTGDWHQPYWGERNTAPFWAYTTAEINEDAPYVLQVLKPGVSEKIVRDYRKDWRHGLEAFDVNTGHSIKRVEFTEEDEHSPWRIYWDVGDPECAPHVRPDGLGNVPKPRAMVAGDYVNKAVTVFGTPAKNLREYLNLSDDEFVASYIAIEAFAGDLWFTDDGGQTNIFYQAHAWYGGGIDNYGHSFFGSPPMVNQYYEDPGGRWSHATFQTTYSCWVGTRLHPEVRFGNTAFGFDPRNCLSDGSTFYFLPRMVADYEEPDRLWAWWPPGTSQSLTGDPQVNFVVGTWTITWGAGQAGAPNRWIAPNSPETAGLWEMYWDPDRYLQMSTFGATAPHVLNEVKIPRFGYWPDGSPVNFFNPPSFKGPGSYFDSPPTPPQGGMYIPEWSPPAVPPHRAEHKKLNATLMAIDPALPTDANGKWKPKWERAFGPILHKAPPVGVIVGGALFMWMAGTVYTVRLADGIPIQAVEVPETKEWTSCDMIPIDGKLCLAGNSGLIFVP